MGCYEMIQQAIDRKYFELRAAVVRGNLTAAEAKTKLYNRVELEFEKQHRQAKVRGKRAGKIESQFIKDFDDDDEESTD